MKALIIFGVGNTGKTSSIRQVYDDLIKSGAKPKLSPKENKGDFIAILEYQGRIITINSAGDDKVQVNHGLEELDKELKERNLTRDCHICATRTRGSSVKAIQEYFQPNERIWFDSCKMQMNLDKYYQSQSQRVIQHI